MSLKDQSYFRVIFRENKANLLSTLDLKYLQHFCERNAGKKGYIIVCVGEMEKSLAQLKFFHGPLLDAFIRLSGDTDRQKFKDYLKENYLDRDQPDKVPSLRDVSVRRMAEFITRCREHLFDEGGYMDEFEDREYREVIR